MTVLYFLSLVGMMIVATGSSGSGISNDANGNENRIQVFNSHYPNCIEVIATDICPKTKNRMDTSPNSGFPQKNKSDEV